MHILELKVLENQNLPLNNVTSYWLFYKAWPSWDTKINDLIWENWPENILQRPDFHYVDLQTTSILRPVVYCIPLKTNLFI